MTGTLSIDALIRKLAECPQVTSGRRRRRRTKGGPRITWTGMLPRWVESPYRRAFEGT